MTERLENASLHSCELRGISDVTDEAELASVAGEVRQTGSGIVDVDRDYVCAVSGEPLAVGVADASRRR